ncbi:MAG: hypothetical protein KGZ25_04645 [Planctomycetes bacterium]|nr:hypothetical protein [Planctomycetota bacterium]
MKTDRENWLATLEHRRPQRILYDSGFTPDLRRRLIEHIGTKDIGGYYGFWQAARLGPRRPDDIEPIDYTPYYEDEELPEDVTFNPVGAARIPADFYHFYRYVSPLRNATSLKELEEYPLPDYSDWDTSHYEETVRQARKEGKVVIGVVGHMYEWAWQIRGYQQFLMDMMERPEWCECLLDRLTELRRFQAVRAARAGADYLHCGDDVANQESLMFSKTMLKDFILSRWESIWQEVKEMCRWKISMLCLRHVRSLGHLCKQS